MYSDSLCAYPNCNPFNTTKPTPCYYVNNLICPRTVAETGKERKKKMLTVWLNPTKRSCIFFFPFFVCFPLFIYYFFPPDQLEGTRVFCWCNYIRNFHLRLWKMVRWVHLEWTVWKVIESGELHSSKTVLREISLRLHVFSYLGR